MSVVSLYKKEITHDEMHKVLDEFYAATESGDYERIPYSQWARLKGSTPLYTICFDFYSDSKEPFVAFVTVIFNSAYEAGNFCSDDGSFGSFLFDKFFLNDESEDDDMSVIKAIDNKEAKETEKKMSNGFNFDFGRCDGDNIRMSMYGLAIKNSAGTWVSYDQKNGTIIDVDILNFDGGKFMFKLPVAIKNIKVGDIIIHNRIPMFIVSIDDCGKLFAVDVRAGEEKCIIPTRNMFGFDFVTKVVSIMDMAAGTPSTDAPFGNLLPFMLMGDNKDIDPLMMVMLMGNGENKILDTTNPLMLYALMKDKDIDSMIPILLCSKGFFNQ